MLDGRRTADKEPYVHVNTGSGSTRDILGETLGEATDMGARARRWLPIRRASRTPEARNPGSREPGLRDHSKSGCVHVNTAGRAIEAKETERAKARSGTRTDLTSGSREPQVPPHNDGYGRVRDIGRATLGTTVLLARTGRSPAPPATSSSERSGAALESATK